MVSEPSETLKEFPIVTNSETEKGFRISKTDSFVWKIFSVSELVTIGKSLRVFESSKILFSIRKLFTGFHRPTRKPIWISEHSETYLFGFLDDGNFFRDEKNHLFCATKIIFM